MLLWLYFVNSIGVFEVFSLLFTNSSWISWKFLNFSYLESCFLRIHSKVRILIHCLKTLKPRKRDETAKISEAGRNSANLDSITRRNTTAFLSLWLVKHDLRKFHFGPNFLPFKKIQFLQFLLKTFTTLFTVYWYLNGMYHTKKEHGRVHLVHYYSKVHKV